MLVMRKTFLKDATILSVYDFHNDEKILLGRMLTGIVYLDQRYRFVSGQRVITSTIKSQDHFEFITKSQSCYVINDEPEHFELRLSEFVVMRHKLYSPTEILEMRQALKLKDDRTIH